MLCLRMQSKAIGRSLIAMPLLFIAAALMTHAGLIEAQTVNWVDASPPAARSFSGMTYDGATHSVVMFGGAGDNSATYGDTWIWSGGWLRLSPVAAPSPRQGLAMAYDGAAGNVVLFGGCTNNSTACTYLNDTWTWDGTTWTQQFPSVSPSPRVSYMAYDEATKTVVLFGGNNGAGALGDTWTWDGVAKTWTPQNPSASPSVRLAPVAWDRATSNVVLFGGGNLHPSAGPGTAYGDTWNWNGTTWTQQFPASSPSARSGAAITYDAGLGLLVLFGGAVNGSWEESANDTWTWNGSDWTQVHPATVPSNRYNFGMAFDPEAKAALMFGGFSTAAARGGTWLLALAP